MYSVYCILLHTIKKNYKTKSYTCVKKKRKDFQVL